ncbi:Calmodulin-binding transcription activator 3 [Morella rubra]|uniref:Calmodulin-binding transcription activator 3 n=1 Tax=Morella rubra TaxID=262757 RepID=A0A6A1VDI8_9ROSI|nr:Calmodulin-binding transcription activator 3 [Morella rubra]
MKAIVFLTFLKYYSNHIFSLNVIPTSGGSLFLFDRKVLRYFRKDGHNWRKKKDGKTVKEAHERLKAGSIDVLHCYYAHGEEDENFQRRSYWMLEEELSHIVLVHYREVKGNRTNFNRMKETEEAIPYPQETEDILPSSEIDSSMASSFPSNSYGVPSQTTDTTSLYSAQASDYEDAESAYNHQASSAFHSYLESQQPMVEKINAGLTDHYFPASSSSKLLAIANLDFVFLTQVDEVKDGNNTGLKNLDFVLWEDVLENGASDGQALEFQSSFLETQPHTIGILPKQENEILGQLFTSNFERQELGGHPKVQEGWQTSGCKWSLDQNAHTESTHGVTSRFHEQDVIRVNLLNSLDPGSSDKLENHPMQDNPKVRLLNVDHGYFLKSDQESKATLEGKSNYSFALKPPLLDGSLREESLKKVDSFNRWMSKELGDVNESHMQSSSGTYWDSVESESRVEVCGISSQVQMDNYVVSPSLSQDQLFSIIDFSPSWAYEGSEIKVLITGRFLKSHEEVENCKWSCMFGEVEVPAEVIEDGVLCCHTPIHKAAKLPFYVTCSNRFACSEVREFEYRVNHIRDVDVMDNYSCNKSEILQMRFGKLLCLSSACSPASYSIGKAAEGGKGPSILDKGGQGVLHFAAALGYDWALQPTIVAGVSVNFRDVNGWTALHWAAFCGRERTVASLVSLGAAPGALTDPCISYPSGRTPADLASINGHKGIAGYLAESALNAHLESLTLDTKEGDAAEISGAKAVQIVSERSATPVSNGELPDGLSMKDSLAALCNASQAAARIHQVFRVQSFQKKQLKEYCDDRFGMSNEQALSFYAVKTYKSGQHDLPVQAAAIRIQNKFRCWKGRKDYLITRQRIVKIQAHVRGHQVRKNYKKITWSVGILEKVILRWRRKGSGLRGFRSEARTDVCRMQDTSSNEDDYDFLKEGRKQTEERLKKALARVKSMVQYPEARDQYSRLLNVVAEIQETKVYEGGLNSSEEMTDFDDNELIDLDALLDEDAHMPPAM